MSNQRGQQNRIDTKVSIEAVTVTIFGESIHSNRDANKCAELLAEVLSALEYKGEYQVVASMQRLKGSSNLQGLSTHGVSINAVMLGYQPNGNDTRATYTLPLANKEEAQKCFVELKNHIGTAYSGPEKAKRHHTDELPVLEAAPVSEVIVAVESSVVTKPTEKPKVYYTKNEEWMETTVLLLSYLADKHPEHQVTKDQVLDLIVQRTHFPNRGLVGPIYRIFMTRGNLVPIDSAKEVFKLVETPPIGFKAHGLFPRKQKSASKVSATKTPPKAKTGRKQKYLSDEEWMRSFMEGLRTLVSTADGLVSKTDLHVFIKQRTNQKKIAATVYTIVEGLKIRGVISDAAGRFYRFVYEPKPDTFEKAVKGIEQARAETAKVFDGFAKTRLPTFAEGMFSKKQILDDFLRLVGAGVAHVDALKLSLAKLYPVSSRSHNILLNYMVHKGYFVRQKKGMYTLGPAGRGRLGLPAVEYKIVAKTAPTPSEVLPPVTRVTAVPEVATAVPTPEPVMQSFLPPGLLLAQQPEANVSSADPAVTLVIANAVRHTKLIEQEADEAEAQQTVLGERNAMLKAKQAEPQGDVEAEVQRRLLAML